MLHLAQRIYNLLDDVKASGKVCVLVAHNGIARVVNSYFNDMTMRSMQISVLKTVKFCVTIFKYF